ncbi:MAG: ABC transporter permease [gamma proteobacterium symbiont of Lucinoma myriamae]|nr:ABC transporter permease [gamma proteobacterium symbiont of Lucinoma myriamae]MCU7833114.1 ABC transporter permease [gamma proteobacterium symbiont of Lucinoma myriamae]
MFSVLGVALGVALVVGIDIASQSARQGFSLSSESITGKASHRVISSEHVLPESIYVQLRNHIGLRKAAPLIKQTVQFNVPDDNTRVDAQLIGIDPLSEADIRNWQQGMMKSLPSGSLQRLLIEDNTVLVENSFLKKYHLRVGDQIDLTLTKQEHEQARQLLIIGSFNAPEVYQTQLTNWLISDISTAQELLNFKGAISQIDVLLDADNEAKVKQIKQLLPDGIQLVKVDEHAKAITRLSQSFELNLTALSLLGLLVAMFLIYNTMMFSVVQRRDLLARMRVLGVSSWSWCNNVISIITST